LAGTQTFNIGDGAIVTLGGTSSQTIMNNDITYQGSGKVQVTGLGVYNMANLGTVYAVDVDVTGRWQQSSSYGSMTLRNGKTIVFKDGSTLDASTLGVGSTTGSGQTGFVRFEGGTININKTTGSSTATTTIDLFNKGTLTVESGATVICQTATTVGDFTSNNNATIKGSLIANANLVVSPQTWFTSGSSFNVNGNGVTARLTKAVFTGSTVSSTNGGSFSIITSSGVTFASGTSLNGVVYSSSTTGGAQFTGTVTVDGVSNFTHPSVSSTGHVVVQAGATLVANAPLNIQTGLSVEAGAILTAANNGALNVFYDQTTSSTARLDLTSATLQSTGTGSINIGNAGKAFGALNINGASTFAGNLIIGSKGTLTLPSGTSLTTSSSGGNIGGNGGIDADGEIMAGAGSSLILSNTGTVSVTFNGGIGASAAASKFVISSGAAALIKSGYVTTKKLEDSYVDVSGTLDFTTGGSGPSWIEASIRLADGGSLQLRQSASLWVSETSVVTPAASGAGSVTISGTITTDLNRNLYFSGVPVTITSTGVLTPLRGGKIIVNAGMNPSTGAIISGSATCQSCTLNSASNSTIQVGEDSSLNTTETAVFTVTGAATMASGNITATSSGRFVVNSGASIGMTSVASFGGAGVIAIYGAIKGDYSASRVYLRGSNVQIGATGEIQMSYPGATTYITGTTYLQGGNITLWSTSGRLYVSSGGSLLIGQGATSTTSYLRGGAYNVDPAGTIAVYGGATFTTRSGASTTDVEYYGPLVSSLGSTIRVTKGVSITGTAALSVSGSVRLSYGAKWSGASLSFTSTGSLAISADATSGFTTGSTFTGACAFNGVAYIYLNGYVPTTRVALITCGSAITNGFASHIIYRTAGAGGRRLLATEKGTITYVGSVMYYDPDAEVSSASTNVPSFIIAAVTAIVAMMFTR
jgi:hypothetical protein